MSPQSRGRYQSFWANSKISDKVGTGPSSCFPWRLTAAFIPCSGNGFGLTAFKIFTGILGMDPNLFFLPPILFLEKFGISFDRGFCPSPRIIPRVTENSSSHLPVPSAFYLNWTHLHKHFLLPALPMWLWRTIILYLSHNHFVHLVYRIYLWRPVRRITSKITPLEKKRYKNMLFELERSLWISTS